jgi:hypothetical protein
VDGRNEDRAPLSFRDLEGRELRVEGAAQRKVHLRVLATHIGNEWRAPKVRPEDATVAEILQPLGYMCGQFMTVAGVSTRMPVMALSCKQGIQQAAFGLNA